jgi:DNA repair exonuclease SbcCD ATPase subunit
MSELRAELDVRETEALEREAQWPVIRLELARFWRLWIEKPGESRRSPEADTFWRQLERSNIYGSVMSHNLFSTWLTGLLKKHNINGADFSHLLQRRKDSPPPYIPGDDNAWVPFLTKELMKAEELAADRERSIEKLQESTRVELEIARQKAAETQTTQSEHIQRLQKQHRDLEADCESTRRQQEISEAKCKEMEDERNEWKAKCKSMEDQRDAGEAKYASIEKERDGLHKDYASIEERVKAVEQDLKDESQWWKQQMTDSKVGGQREVADVTVAPVRTGTEATATRNQQRKGAWDRARKQQEVLTAELDTVKNELNESQKKVECLEELRKSDAEAARKREDAHLWNILQKKLGRNS